MLSPYEKGLYLMNPLFFTAKINQTNWVINSDDQESPKNESFITLGVGIILVNMSYFLLYQ